MKIKILLIFLVFLKINISGNLSIDSINPSSADNTNSAEITLIGQNFDNSCKIYFKPSSPYILSNFNISDLALDVFVSGNYAYVACGSSGLKIVNISDPKDPKSVGTVDTSGFASKVTVSGNYAYVADTEGGLQIINISNPAVPTIASSINTSFDAYGIYISGNYAYVACGNIDIIDITTPTNPTLVSSFNTPGDSHGVYVVGNYAYVADGNLGLHIVNVSDKSNPKLAGGKPTPDDAYDIYVSGNYAYLATGDSGLQIIDISIPTATTIVGSVITSGKAFKIFLNNNYAYLACGISGLQVIDISSPQTPIVVSSITTIDEINGIYVKDMTAYFASSGAGLVIADISEKKNSSIVSKINTIDWIYAVTFSNNYIYAACGNSGIEIFNVQNKANPVKVSNLDTTGNAYGIALSGMAAYVANGEEGLEIVDISNPANPFVKGLVDTPGTAYGISVLGSYAYIADGEEGLQIIDISSATNPIVKGSVDTPGIAYGISVLGSYAYIADGEEGLQIIDISNPAQPKITGNIKTFGILYSICVENNFVYAACGTVGLQIINVKDKLKPILVSSVDTQGNAFGISLSGNYAYIADNEFGIQVIDIRDILKPIKIGNIDTSGNSYNVFATDNYVYVADLFSLIIIHKKSSGIISTGAAFVDAYKETAISPRRLIPGKYNIEAVNDSGEQNIFYNGFNVTGSFPSENQPPITNLAANPDSGFASLDVNFTANVIDSDNNIMKYEWDFNDDGFYEISKTYNMLTYTFNNFGIYNVFVKVTDYDELVRKSNIAINVSTPENIAPTVSLTASPNSGIAPLEVEFTANGQDSDGTIIQYEWDFNDDSIYEEITINNKIKHTLISSGTFIINVKVIDNSGAIAKANIIVSVSTLDNIPPTASLTAAPESGSAPLSVEFTANAQDSDGAIIKYEWNFNDDSIFDTTTQSNKMNFTFKTTGSFVIRVQVTDNFGATAKASANVNIYKSENKIPIVNLSASKESGIAPLEIEFTAEAQDSDGTIVKYEWDFDDNSIYDMVTSVNKTKYTYTKVGTYIVNVRITDNAGATAKAKVNVSISSLENRAPLVSLIANPDLGIIPLNVEFTAQANDPDGTIIKYEWDFNDDTIYETTTTNNKINYTYTAIGSYIAKVKVTDNNGAEGKASTSINALNKEQSPPKVTLKATPISGFEPLIVKFNAEATDSDNGTIIKYEWDFDGDSNFDITTFVNNIKYTYKKIGDYVATVRITDNDNLIAKSSLEIKVNKKENIVSVSSSGKSKKCIITKLCLNKALYLNKIRDTKILPNFLGKYIIYYYYKIINYTQRGHKFAFLR